MSKKLMAAARKQVALDRQREIQRKSQAQRLQNSGAGAQGAHTQLTEENRLIRCDHYKRTGLDLKLSNKRDELARLMQEKKRLLGQTFRHVKRDSNGKTLSVIEKQKA